jgi:hypothetical protein
MDRWSRFLENTCAPERFSLAKARAAKLVHHIAPLFLMHEANAVIIYSQQLSEQIPRSYAAHAFNQFQHSMHLFEIIRLCAIWDKPNPDRESIPTIIALFNTPELIDQLVTEVRASYANAPPGKFYDGDDAQEMATKKSWWKRERETIIRQVEKVTRDKLSFAVGKAAEIQQSSRLKRLVQFRDRYIAHNLDIAQPAMSDEASVEHLKYGDETTLLADTVAVASALHQGLTFGAFDWNGSRAIARRNARALWEGCSFQTQGTREAAPSTIPLARNEAGKLLEQKRPDLDLDAISEALDQVPMGDRGRNSKTGEDPQKWAEAASHLHRRVAACDSEKGKS